MCLTLFVWSLFMFLLLSSKWSFDSTSDSAHDVNQHIVSRNVNKMFWFSFILWNLYMIKTRALINIIWQNQCLHLLCQSTCKTLSDPNVPWCPSVTPPSITRRGLCRQGSLFYPSVNHIPRQTARPAARPHNSCHVVLRHKHRPLPWLRAPEPSGAPGIWSEASSGDHFKDISTQALVKTTNLDTETCCWSAGDRIQTNYSSDLTKLAEFDGLVCLLFSVIYLP